MSRSRIVVLIVLSPRYAPQSRRGWTSRRRYDAACRRWWINACSSAASVVGNCAREEQVVEHEQIAVEDRA
jgi:hypothetical protein